MPNEGHEIPTIHIVITRISERAGIHVSSGWHPCGTRHLPSVRRHLVHHVVRKMAVNHPVTGIELIDKTPAWFHRLLADAGLTVVLDGVFKSMPLDGSLLRWAILYDHAPM